MAQERMVETTVAEKSVTKTPTIEAPKIYGEGAMPEVLEDQQPSTGQPVNRLTPEELQRAIRLARREPVDDLPPPPVRGNGGEGGTGGPGSRGPEGPPEPPELGPEGIWGPEFRAWGIDIATRIDWLEALPNRVKYGNPDNARRLDAAYKEWKVWFEMDTARSSESTPFNPADLETEVAVGEEVYPEQQLPDETAEQLFNNLKDLHTGARTPDREELLNDTGGASIRGKLSSYFKEAKRRGFLNVVDSSLKSIEREIQKGLDQGLSPDEIRAGVEEQMGSGREGSVGLDKRLELIKKIAQESFEQSTEAEREGLQAVLDIYIDVAVRKLTHVFNPQLEPFPSIEAEFKLEEEVAGLFREVAQHRGEIYWRPTYANYFTVYARTKEQFEVAKETFLIWVGKGLGKDPQEIFQKVKGFEDAITSAGQRVGLIDYASNLKLELDILAAVKGASFSAEQYKAQFFKAFWEEGAKNEGPARMKRLIRTGRGVLAAVLHKFDKDPRLELLFSPHGSKGQLMEEENAQNMGDLEEQVLGMLIREVLGIALKKYHPDDGEQIADNNMYERNLGEILKFRPDEEFMDLYEGFDRDEQEALFERLDQHPAIIQIKAGREFVRQVNEQLRTGQVQLTQEQMRDYTYWKSGGLIRDIRNAEKNAKFARGVDVRVKKGQYPRLNQQQTEIYDAWKADRLTPGSEARPLTVSDLETWERLNKARRIREYLEKGGKPADLRSDLGEDEALMYEEAENIVTLAFELYGAMGEKARREGAVLVVDRKDAAGEYKNYVPFHWAEKGGHFVENWTKATYGPAGEYLDPQIRARFEQEQRREIHGILADELFYRVGQARRMYTWAVKTYGFDAKFWDFTLLRNGRPIDINTLGYSQYGENTNEDNLIERYKYAVPENPRILGYNLKGEEVILVFDDEGRPVVNWDFDKDGKAVIYDQPTKSKEIKKRDKNDPQKIVTIQRERKRIEFDNLDKNTKARPMILKRPKEEETVDQKTGKKRKRVVENPDGSPVVEQVHVDFDKIIHELSSHPYVRWTGHPYPGYQEEDRGLMMQKKSFEEAREIIRGERRPQDATLHALQLINFDPTLERIGHYNHVENVECAIILAAGEESYISHWRIGDELYLNFFPEDADREKVGVQYILQDRGGSTKQWFHQRAEAAYWLDARARRLRTFIPYMTLHFASMSEMWGAPGGALDVFRMIGFEKYKLVGQFAMDKWVNQTAAAEKLREAYADWLDEQAWRIREGLGRKLNNEADVNMKQFYEQVLIGRLDTKERHEDLFEKYLVAVRESLGRMERVEERNTVLESVMRAPREPLNHEGLEVYRRRADGSYETDAKGNKIITESFNLNRDSGSGRHTNRFFHYRFVSFIRSDVYRALYPDTVLYYSLMDQKLADYPRLAEEAAKLTGKKASEVTGWDWLEGKMNN